MTAADDAHGWIDIADAALPELVRHVSPAPSRLWFSGDLKQLRSGLRIGIVGSRHPRDDARALARRIAADAARAGCTIVSGLAIGIDGIAHQAAIDAGGTSIGVVAGGLGSIYPRRHCQLAQRIAGSVTATGVAIGHHHDARGVMVSEYGGGDEPALPYRFQQRNRLIAALSHYLVVIQATRGSGSMGTARHALELGVPIGIVPSAPNDPCYAGGMTLIQDGADAVVDGRSLFRRLTVHGVMEPGCAGVERDPARPDPFVVESWRHCGLLSDGAPLADHPLTSLLSMPRTIDEIAELAGLPRGDVRRMLRELEETRETEHLDDGTWVMSCSIQAREGV